MSVRLTIRVRFRVFVSTCPVSGQFPLRKGFEHEETRAVAKDGEEGDERDDETDVGVADIVERRVGEAVWVVRGSDWVGEGEKWSKQGRHPLLVEKVVHGGRWWGRTNGRNAFDKLRRNVSKVRS